MKRVCSSLPNENRRLSSVELLLLNAVKRADDGETQSANGTLSGVMVFLFVLFFVFR